MVVEQTMKETEDQKKVRFIGGTKKQHIKRTSTDTSWVPPRSGGEKRWKRVGRSPVTFHAFLNNDVHVVIFKSSK
jgi:hypothetical protein